MSETPTTLPAEYWHKRWHEARAERDRAVELLKELRAKATDPRAFPGADPYTRTWTRQEWVAEAVDPFLAALILRSEDTIPGEVEILVEREHKRFDPERK